jgi:serine/threonine-protein kinase
MEYIEGKELKDYFDAKHPFDLATIFRLTIELLDALDFAHEAGVIHRDVKPANLMVDAGGHAKLADFGVARLTEPEGEQGEATRAGAMVGTPSYMSPEQIQGQTIDRRTDILFYQFLTGKKPFEGGQWELAKKIVQDDPVWPSAIVQIPPAIDRVVAKALAKAPEKRYQTARKFAEALKRIREGKPLEDGEVLAPASQGSEAETEFWNEVKDSKDPDELALYIEQFPAGVFVELAQRKVAELRGKKA